MLTSKSMMFNGRYIEDLIEGYTTIDVEGRGMAEVEIDSVEVGRRDGAIFRGARYKPRLLTIKFVIEGDDLGFNPDNTTLIERVNQLNGILDIDHEVPIIFRDEDDKFYMGIRNGLPEFEMSLGIAAGKFEIYCSDPFKYSVVETTAYPTTQMDGFQVFSIKYDGTRIAYPKFRTQFYTQNTAPRVSDINESELTEEDLSGDAEGVLDTTSKGNEDELIAGKGACGYVAFFDNKEHVLQFGNPNEDGQPAATLIPKTLVNQNFQSYGKWPTSIQNQWIKNNGTLPANSTNQQYTQNGDFKIDKAYNNAQSAEVSSKLLNNKEGTNVKYTVTAKCDKRTTTSVRVTVTITSSGFTKDVPYDAVLTAYVKIHDTDHKKVLKSASKSKKDVWKKGKKINTTLSFTVSDLDYIDDVIGGIKFRVERSGGSGSVGKLNNTSCNNMNIPVYISPAINSYYLTPDIESLTPGTNGVFYGPTIYRNIPADASSSVGWEDFEADFHVKLSVGNQTNDTSQTGGLYVALITGTYSNGTLTNPKILAGVTVRKYQVGNNGYVCTIGNGSYITKDDKIDLSYINPSFGANRKVNGKEVTTNKHILIKKSGTKVQFIVGGKTDKWDSAGENDKAYRIMIGAFYYAGQPRVDWIGFYNVKFTPLKINQIETTIPFTTGDFLLADSSTGDIFLNDVPRPELGALGNDWEGMCLTPGDEPNYYGAAYSDWCNETAYRQCNADDYYDENLNDSNKYYQYSGGNYVQANPTEEQFNQNKSSYYILESCAPEFSIVYREVYA